MRVRLFALLSATALFVLAAAPASASGEGHGYLALGDSVAFGYSPLLVNAGLATNPSVFVGYPDVVAQRLGLQLTNASCPGETSGGFLSLTNGLDFKCLGYRFFFHFPLHVNYTTAQLAFALQYLTTHPDVQLVTMDIGANDVFKLETACGGTANTCFTGGLPAGLGGIDANLRFIYSEIRNVAHYRNMIVTLTYYSLGYDPATAAGTKALNAPIIDATLANGGLVASGFDAFQKRALAHDGSSCGAGLLIVLSPGVCDVHPSALGRDALAGEIVRTIEKTNQRQLHLEGGSAAAGLFHTHVAAVRGHDRVDDREPQPRAAAVPAAAGVRAIEGLEDPLRILGLQPRAVIGHGQAGRTVFGRDRDLDWRPGGRVDKRVADEVAQDLSQPRVVPSDDDWS